MAMDFVALVSSMPWQAALFLRVIVAFVLCQLLIKWLTDRGSRTGSFALQFVVAFVLTCVAVFFLGGVSFTWFFGAVVALAFANTFGTFFQWKAMAISQTRTALFTFWDDVIAMTLSYFFLAEAKLMSPLIALGVGLSFLSLMLFVRHALRKAKQIGTEVFAVPLRFYIFVALFSIVWGVSYFGQRLWAHQELSIPTFLLAWYTGALVAALLLYIFYNDASDKKKRLGLSGLFACIVLGMGIVVSMSLGLLAFRAPQVVVQPILFVSEMVIPALLGLYVFREGRQFDRIEGLYFALAILGAFVVGFAFSR